MVPPFIGGTHTSGGGMPSPQPRKKYSIKACIKQIGGVAFGLGGALGPWLGGYLFDLSGHYTQAFWIGIAATVLATAGVMLAGKGIHARRRGMEREVMLGEE